MKTYIVAAAVAAFVLLPGTTKAFEVVETNAYDLGFAQLFMIEFEFGYLNAEALLPILTTQTDVELEYSRDGEVLAGGQTGAIFLSDAPTLDGYYRVPEGERDTVTLLAIYQNENASADMLAVTAFDHLIMRDGELRQMSPSAAQLESYTAVLE